MEDLGVSWEDVGSDNDFNTSHRRSSFRTRCLPKSCWVLLWQLSAWEGSWPQLHRPDKANFHKPISLGQGPAELACSWKCFSPLPGDYMAVSSPVSFSLSKRTQAACSAPASEVKGKSLCSAEEGHGGMWCMVSQGWEGPEYLVMCLENTQASSAGGLPKLCPSRYHLQ